MNKKISKVIVVAVIVLVLLIVVLNCFSTVGPTERGVKITLGKPNEEVLSSGLHFKLPFVQSIKKYDITPVQYKKSLGIGTDGALTADQQTMGVDYELFWKYKPEELYETTLKYSNKDIIYERISTPLKEIIKDEVSKISVTELVGSLTTISQKTEDRLKERLSEMPIAIESVSIVNIDWSDDYDKQIKETANRRQQVQIAQQEAEIAAAQAQKLVKEAEARRQAAESDAQAEIARANGDAEAKKIRADAQAYENQKIAQNLAVMQAQWESEVELERAKKWDGVEVSSQSIYVPNTYDLKSGR